MLNTKNLLFSRTLNRTIVSNNDGTLLACIFRHGYNGGWRTLWKEVVRYNMYEVSCDGIVCSVINNTGRKRLTSDQLNKVLLELSMTKQLHGHDIVQFI